MYLTSDEDSFIMCNREEVCVIGVVHDKICCPL